VPKADIGVRPRHVRFTPESGHRNRPADYLRRTGSGSLAIFAAIRRALAGCTPGAALQNSKAASPHRTSSVSVLAVQVGRSS